MSGDRAGKSPTTLRIALFVDLLSVALLAGLLVGVLLVERALLEVSAAVYIAVEKPKHAVFAPIMPIVNTTTIVSGLLTVLLLRGSRQSWAFRLSVVALLCTAALTTTTLLVNVPINSAIITSWSAQDPPSNWAEIRDQWNLFHTIRTGLAVTALICLLLAALTPPAPSTAAHRRSLDHAW